MTLLGGAAVAWPHAARAQQPIGRTGKMPRVGMLMPGPAAHSAATLKPFYQGLHELGYIEGQNLAIERRDGDWKPDRLPALAAELVRLKVDFQRSPRPALWLPANSSGCYRPRRYRVHRGIPVETPA
jgi:putative tryptophan/tyrosine transport system substrate-binding protein